MINQVLLQKEGGISCEGRMIDTDPVACLAAPIRLEGGYRLRSFFKMLEKYPMLQKLNPFLPSLVEQYRTLPAAPAPCKGGECLEIRKNIEIIGYPGGPKLDIYTSLKRETATSDQGRHSADLGMLINSPLQLGMLKHVIFGDQVDELAFETVFTLFEFIEGIAWEVSFWGTPRQCEIRGGP